MVQKGKILIADRNRHVRDFLQREFLSEGYEALVARDGLEVRSFINGDDPPDLLILDLELPFLDNLELLAQLQSRQRPLPIIIHTFLGDEAIPLPEWPGARRVEKAENPAHLKAAVAEIMRT